ncbi:dephospho-CoA kinase [Rhodoferax mekongensis]|uniref:dephospho-CoA kinase n=1 Tax=Rhodoferax mekongensis TaxID=3068341 RepID=UPI0028BEEBAD|nr:dephospho-CoA kinase [Rhodoferax sp. TBRC 17199]MDT7516475.1 dephospho-CoA kinase [Rhodoferax sp. TBRC 17199]NBX21074.1 dephospho-CoA kinase [Betaproteobacteria bacterium]
MHKGFRVGLTGGMGSGKSTVARFLSQRGAYLIDADAISRETTSRGGAALEELALAFGPDIIGTDGGLDRVKMRELAFNDPDARRRLESIVHPLVKASIELATLRADAMSAPCVVYDIPLLIESRHWRQTLETIVVVDCTEGTQIDRVRQRSGLTETEVRAVLRAQAVRARRLRAADYVIFNDGITLNELEALTQQISVQFGL